MATKDSNPTFGVEHQPSVHFRAQYPTGKDPFFPPGKPLENQHAALRNKRFESDVRRDLCGPLTAWEKAAPAYLAIAGYGLACARAQLSLVPALMLRRSKIADSVRESACLDMSLVPALMLRRSTIADSVRTQRVLIRYEIFLQ